VNRSPSLLRASALAGLAAGALAGAACVSRDVVATVGGGDRAAFCAGSGPPVLADGTCTGQLAAANFRQAVCACGLLSLSSDLATDGFDSRVAPWAPGGGGADVAGNAGVDFGGALDVGGAFTVAGGVQAGTALHVLSDLQVSGGLGRPSSAVTVGGAAGIGGGVDVASLNVTGTLTTPAGAPQSGAVAAAAMATAPVSVPLPCRCDPDQVVDVAGLVAQQQLSNHDAEAGLDPAALADLSGDATLELPCGRFYLSRIQATNGGGVTLRATGRNALFVGGNVTLDGPFTVELAPGAELDLFVAGVLNVPGGVRLGDPQRPQALRIYLGAPGSLNLSASSTVAANVYAPTADVSASAPLELFGALLVDHLNLSGKMTVHYDRAIASAGLACTP
jgi:hypothetical protein